MRSRIHRLSLGLGAILVLGLPLAAIFRPAPPPAEAPSRSTLGRLYQDWQTRYVQNGGDANVVMGLGWTRGLSKEFSTALGRVELDMLTGRIRTEVEGLGGIPADLWLVDNQEGPGKSVLPESGDRMVRVGALERRGQRDEIIASLGQNFFLDFELDLVVVTRAGQSPAEGSVLYGTRPFFERLYTKARLERERSQRSPVEAIFGMLSPREAEANQVLVAHNLVTQQVSTGADLFFRGTFNGNGRTCGTCHRVEHNQTIDQAFIATLPASDPIFIAEKPAAQGGVPGLERPALMRNFGLILENLDGFQDPTGKFTMRSTPHTLSMFTSILAPVGDGRAANQRVGWSGDGAPDSVTLRLFSAGAVFQHFTKTLNRVAGVDFRLPTDAELDAMEAFMLTTGRRNELSLAEVTLTDPGAEAGRLIFMDPTQGKCALCHLNAGALSQQGGNRNFDTGVERASNPARAVESFPFDGGFGKTNPFDANSFGDGTFNTPSLIEAADTPPFFHNNVAATVEDAVIFYSGPEFQASPSGRTIGGINLSPQQNQDVADFLRVVNAAFNIAISVQRNEGALSLENVSFLPQEQPMDQCTTILDASCSPGVDGKRETVNKLLSLANVEAQDAIEVLQAKGLNPNAVTLLQTAISQNQQAIAANASNTRKQLMQNARTNFLSAKSQLGTGLSFTLGEGNLLF